MIELGQRLGIRCFVIVAAAETVDGLEDGMSQCRLIGHSLPCDVISRTHVGSRGDERQTPEVVNVVFGFESLEWRDALVVIHGQYAVEGAILAVAEEIVDLIGSEGVDPDICQFLYGGDDLLCLLLAGMLVAVVGVEGQNGDARVGDAHVFAQGGEKHRHLLDNRLCGDGRAHVLEGHLVGHECHSELFVDQDVKPFAPFADARLDVFGLVGDVIALHRETVSIGRTGHQHVDQAVLIVGQCLVQGLDGGEVGLRRRYTQLHLDFLVKDRQHVHSAVLRLGGSVDDAEIGIDAQRVAVISRHLGRPIYNRCAKL